MFRRIKNVISCILVLAVLISVMPISVVRAERQIKVVINGKEVSFNEFTGYPFINRDQRTLVPLRVTLEAFGAVVGWENSSNMAYAKKDGITVYIPAGTDYIIVDGKIIKNDTHTELVGDRTYCPIRKVLEALGGKVSWDEASGTVIAKKSIEMSLKERNINSMLSSTASNASIWQWYAETERYPYHIYLDNYYTVKGGIELLKGAESYFRVNIAPSLIGLGDIVYNDDILKGQSKERSKEILLSLIKKHGEGWWDNSLRESTKEYGDLLASYLEDAIKEAPRKYDYEYEKLNQETQRINKLIEMQKGKGAIKTFVDSKYIDDLAADKAKLTEKLQANMKAIYSDKIVKTARVAGIGLNIVSFVDASAEEYQELYSTLNASADFIELMQCLEDNCKTYEVREAAKEIKEKYRSLVEKESNMLLSSIGTGSISALEGIAKTAYFPVAIVAFLQNSATNIGGKIDAFEKLRLTDAISMTLDDKLREDILAYTDRNGSREQKEKSIESIYKNSNYVFALREQGTTRLYEYLMTLYADKKSEKDNLDTVMSNLSNIYNLLNEDLKPKINFSDMVDDKKIPHKKGVLKYDSGAKKYEGELIYDVYKNEDVPDGEGRQYRDDQSNSLRYEGSFKKGSKEGKGIIYTAIGKKIDYEGVFKKGGIYVQQIESGNYELKYGGRTVYTGEWKDGQFNGKGTYYWLNGDVYSGEWIAGVYGGYGEYSFNDGRKYTGQLKDGKYNGHGTYTWQDGLVYTGEWVNDVQNGQGTLEFSDGKKYIGEFKNGKSNGAGELTYKDGNKYVGQFKDDYMKGQGTHYWTNGNTYKGEFENGKYNGQGVFTWADGSKYVGEFKEGKENGKGIYYWADGSKYVGEFKNDMKDGKGIYYWADGTKYDGEWKNDKMNGYGIMYLNDGTILKGTFKDGVLVN